jgi:tetratricopeptide (TPR) repeat protein
VGTKDKCPFHGPCKAFFFSGTRKFGLFFNKFCLILLIKKIVSAMKNLALTALFVFSGIFLNAQTEFNALYDKANEKYSAAKYAEAQKDFESCTRLSPGSSDAWYMVALCKYMQGFYDSAIPDLDKSIQLNPLYDSYYQRGLCKHFLKRYEDAVTDFNSSISLKSDYAKSYVYRGASNYFISKDDAALTDLNLAIALDPKIADAFYYRGLVKYQKSDDAGAVEDFTKSIEIKPMYDAYYYRGAARYMLKNYEGALSDYNMSAALKPEYYQAWLEKGMACYMLAKDDDAISNFNKAIALNPKSGKAFYYRGQSKSYKGDKAGADADTKKAEELGYSAGGNKGTNSSTYSTTKSAGPASLISPSIPTVDWLNPILDHMNITEDKLMLQACLKSSEAITSCKLFVNDSEIPAQLTSQPNNNDCKTILKQNVVLKQGGNVIKISLVNAKGESTTETRSINVNKALDAKPGEKRIALVIGNSGYTNSGQLKNPVNDAELMAATLGKLGFYVIKRTNADKKTMEDAIKEFSKKLPEYNVILFYYAGHGMQIDGVNYLLPIDVTLMDKSDAKFEAVSVNFVVEELERYPNNTSVVILDACRNNPFRSFSRGGEHGFKAIPPASGTIISFATSEGSVASDGSGNNGLYTEELVKQIVVPQPIESVFKKTRVAVEEKSGNQQSPQEWSKLKGDFYFVK